MKKQKILVTGGAGFIGSALIEELNQRGIEDILVVDFLGEDERYKNLVPLRFDDYMEADRLLETIDEHALLLSDITQIFHLGACSSTTAKDARYLIHNNYEFSKHLAQWALSHGIRFTYASSAATYGDGSQGMDDQNADIQALHPLNMYGYSKHLFDLYAQKRGFLDKVIGLKYFNVFGPNEYHKEDMRSLVHKACGQIQETGSVSLFKSHHPDYKDGEQKRDFLYIKDAVKMTLHLSETKHRGLFNIGSGEANTWNDLVHAIFKALDKPAKINYIDMPEQLREKYQYYTCADISKLRQAGFKDTVTPLEDAVSDYVQNYIIPGKHLGE